MRLMLYVCVYTALMLRNGYIKFCLFEVLCFKL